MALTQITEDYYTILEVSDTADVATIKSSYKRLAKTTHPDKNTSNPNATAEFQRLQEAYSTLCDSERRSAYDIEYVRIKCPQQTNPRTTTDTAQRQPSPENENTDGEKREKKLRKLNRSRTRQADEVLKEKRVLNKIQGELDQLQEDAVEDAREEAAEGSWWGYIASYITRNAQEREEAKKEREYRKLDRRTAQIIREKELERQRTKVQILETSLRATNGDIKRIQCEILQEEQRKSAAEAEEQRRRRQAEAEREEEMRRKAKERWEAEVRTRPQRATGRSRASKASCDHKTWWPQVEGRHLCSHCSTVTTWFGFQCPSCEQVACASCRNILKEARSGQFGSRNSRKRYDNSKSRWPEPTLEEDADFGDYGDYSD